MPQPIDPLMELNRISASERMQQIADRASLQAQGRMSEALAEDQARKESTVKESENKSDEVDEELKRKNPFAGRKKNRSPNNQSTGKQQSKKRVGEEPHHFDVSI